MKLFRFIAAVGLVVIATLYAGSFINLAYAQAVAAPTTEVVIPWGDWLSAGASNLNTILAALVMFALRKLPARFLTIITTTQVDQMLLKAIDFAINRTAGASKGQVLAVDVGNSVLAEAIRYVISYAPKWLIQFMGGEQGVRDKIIARLDVEASAALK